MKDQGKAFEPMKVMWRAATSATLTAAAGLLALQLAGSDAQAEAEAVRNQARTIYVAPNGDDTAAGSAGAPLATLEAARDRIREVRQIEGERKTVISIHGDIHKREAAFRLSEADSGTLEAPIIYRGAVEQNGKTAQQARLSGGRRITNFTPVTNGAALDRLPEHAREHVVQADLTAHDITNAGTLHRRGFGAQAQAALELFFENEPMTLARWPNAGWTTIASAPADDAQDEDARTIGFAGDRPERWVNAPEAWAFGYWNHGWADEHMPIESIDTEARRITLGARHSYGFREEQRFYVYNVLEELDTPGEWYVDRETNLLYFWPPEGTALDEAEVMVSVLEEPLIVVENASHVRFENLVLEGTRDTAVTISGGEKVTLAGSVIRNVGRHGVTVSNGRRHRIVSCDLHHLGERGIHFSGGDRQTLTHAGHEAINNHIHHFSRWSRTYRAAIHLSGVGHIAEHNLIHDAPHMAIGFGGNDHRIAFNEIHHVLTQTDDAGALYIGRDWTARGHEIEHNFIHHSGNQHARDRDPEGEDEELEPHVTRTPLAIHRTNLIYLDDAASGITIRGNLLHDGGRAIMIGGGRDNLVEGNLVIGGDMAVWMDGRGIGWASEHIKRGGHWGIWDRLEAVPYDQPPYSDRYPGLAELPENDPHGPVGNRIAQNLLANNERPIYFQHDISHYAELEDNIEIQEEESESLSTLPRADLIEMARDLMNAHPQFEPLPLDRIGLYTDAYRQVAE
ncbi:MAG: right-handed parallel beta-helix repeat-containing protein [Opitutales bacterium]